MDSAAAEELTKLVRDTYEKSARKALEAIKRHDMTVSLGGGTNTRAMRLVMENAVDALMQANHYFGRVAQDRIRQITLDAVAEKLSTGQTIREMQKRLVEELTAEGMQAVIGANGRQMRVESYAAMVARTTTREATNTATIDIGEQWGYDLVKFTTHFPTCEVCAPVQGRVFSHSGKDPDFPPLGSVPGFNMGFKSIHPNCRHVLVITARHWWSDEECEKYLADAKKPVRGDTRTQEEVDRYNAAQKKNRDRWQDRRQWERYRAALGDEAPKTLNGFRNMKRADSKNWKDLQDKYRQVNRENAIIQAAKEPGGRHSGKYAYAGSWSDASVRKAAKSYAGQVLEHDAKIKHPSAYDKSWGKKTLEQQQGLLKKWQKDMDRNDELRVIMESILKERGLL